jgi:O-antigen biosynthesis protein
MDTETDISVIIVNYNVKDFLLQCLRSVENSSKGLDVEIIVVDNHSSDGSVEMSKSVFPDVKYIELEENIGFARANNLGIERAEGRYVLILNPDTILDENTLNIMFDYMEKNSEVACSGCKVLNPDGSFQLACRRGFPTPWASFSKLFGLQKLFPNSRIFAKYNQTFRSVDESYYIDAVVGAFMFCRRDALLEVNGFDTDFFMYGEDIDLCYRLSKAGWKISYVHTTSIIHYKGESTKRSSLNEIKLFYDAMKIFSNKHYSGSSVFLLFLRLGIFLRSILAYANKKRRDIIVILSDIIAINLALIFSTWYRFDGFFSFPDYAYPTVFIVVTVVMFVSMFFVGEYFETKPTARRALFGLMISFFILSSLTYYFKDYAFSRGVLLMTIGLTALSAIAVRGIFSLIDKTRGSEADRRIIIVGLNQQAKNIIESLRNSEVRNINIMGVVTVGFRQEEDFCGYKVLGNIEYLNKIISKYEVHEVIITDENISKNELMKLLSDQTLSTVRFHIAQEYEELLSSRIINEITGIQPTMPIYNISRLRFKVLKRLFDIIIAVFLLTIGFPVLYLLVNDKTKNIKLLLKVLSGRLAIVGIYPVDNEKSLAGKQGITGLVHISKPELLSDEAIRNLNNYYRQFYSLSLDIDIIIKFLIRKKSGNKLYT